MDMWVGYDGPNHAWTYMTWDEPVDGLTYAAYRFSTYEDGSVDTEQVARTQPHQSFRGHNSNSFVMVVAQEGNEIVAATGLYDWEGHCIDLCSVDSRGELGDDIVEQTAGTPRRSIAVAPVLIVIGGRVIAQVVVRVAQRAVAWCIANPGDCTSRLTDAAQQASQLNDQLNPDEPAGEAAIEQAEDLLNDGYELADDQTESLVVLERDDDRVVIGVNGDTVVTTEVTGALTGRPESVTITTQTIDRGLFGGTSVESETIDTTTYFYSNGEAATGSVRVVQTDNGPRHITCSGSTGSSLCASPPPTTPTPGGGCDESGSSCPGNDPPGHNVPNPPVCCSNIGEPTPTETPATPGPGDIVCCSTIGEKRTTQAVPTVATHDANGRPYCQSPSSDPDGDGWGWENNASCVVR